MSTFALTGTLEQVTLNDGVAVRAPAMVGSLREVDARARAFEAVAFDALLEAAGLQRYKVIELDAQPVSGQRALGSADKPTTLDMDVKLPGDMAALVLMEDESGAVSWHRPAAADGARGLEPIGQQRFSIRLASSSSAAGSRSLLGNVFKKILKVFVYPIAEFVAGAIGTPIVRAWELAHRPYQLRTYTSANYQLERSRVAALGPQDWAQLNGKRALLFLHGTFSSCDAFRAMPQSTLAALEQAYGRRMIAFNHPTLSDSPLANVQMLQQQLPNGVTLDVDVIAHSRGGLVARQLAALNTHQLRLGKVVLVGVPNRGTALASANHVGDLLDRYTTLLKLVPGPVGAVLDAIVFVVKALAQGLMKQLAGISAMDPSGAYLKQLNDAQQLSTADYYAIGSNYEPKPGTALFNISRVLDAAADNAFDQAHNDLVVPTLGTTQLPNAALSSSKIFTFGAADAVIHTDYFSQERTSTQLTSWLAAAGGARGERGVSRARAARLAPDVLQGLRAHVINLSEGTFRRSGHFVTTQSDVDAIFKNIENWAQTQPQAPKLMIWAHGGLIGEQAGLDIARKHVAWWKQNGIYPLYFVWETGFLDALGSVADSAFRKLLGRGARDLQDFTTDPVVEHACRALGGVKLWGAMKQNAARASQPDGGAHYVAERLAALRQRLPQVEVHAAGHSAGSIFQAHFLPAFAELNAGLIQSLHLLAPAIRIDEFDRRLVPLIGKNITRTTMYTMQRDYELADNCFGVYGKSLLYLIHHALEPEARTPILGLEMSVLEDNVAARALGLSVASDAAQVVWSRTEEASGNDASLSTTHGGFDDDPATMGSIAARVLGTAEPRVPYPDGGLRGELRAPDAWLLGVDISGWNAPARNEMQPAAALAPTSVVTGPAVANDVLVAPAPAGSGRRLALCVGIDAYPGSNRLEGCVNDAGRWAEYLRSIGFEVTKLLDIAASHQGITGALQQLLQSARSGDSVVFQYAGHGYHVPDNDGDEPSGEDQALVPYDFEQGAFLIDDDLRALLVAAPSGVRVTCFMDCCHSGTNTRLLLDRSSPQRGGKRRFLQVTEEQRRVLVDKHGRWRSMLTRDAAARGRSFDNSAMTWVSFAACQDWESALEHDGSGDFTRIALQVLSKGTGLRHTELFEQIRSGFGPKPAQTPVLDCSQELRDLVVFQAS